MIQVGSPQWFYMAESEGQDNLVDTRTAKLNAVAREAAQRNEDYLSYSDIKEIALDHGIRNFDINDYVAVINKF